MYELFHIKDCKMIRLGSGSFSEMSNLKKSLIGKIKGKLIIIKKDENK